jgi:drug/metabolite transporter (DMT)-like permease
MTVELAQRPVATRSRYHYGLALVIASTIAWSLAGLFTRLLTLDAWTMLAWRGLFGGLGVMTVMVLLKGPGALRDFGRLGWAGWAYGLLGAGAMICFITSLRFTTVAHSAVIYATLPFLAGALGWVALGEKPSSGAAFASLAALAGVGLMVGFGPEGGLFGDLLALAMTVAMAIFIVIARIKPGIPTMAASAVSGLVSAAMALPFAHALGVTSHDLWLLAAFGLVNSALGLALFSVGSRHLPPIETALIGALDAPLAPVWVWLVFSEMPSLPTVIGGGIVFVAVGAHILREAITKGGAA